MLVWIFLMCPHKMIFFRIHISGQFSCPVVSDSLWPHGLQHLRLPVLHYLLEFAQIHVHWVSDAIQPSHPLLCPSSRALNLLSIRVFSNESALLIRWPKYWSFSFSISPSNEYSVLISFRIDLHSLISTVYILYSIFRKHYPIYMAYKI